MAPEEYRLLFDGNPCPIWVYDLETLAFLAVNEAAIRHYGYSRDEFLAMTIKDIRPAEDVPAVLESVANTRSPIDESYGWRHRRKDGTVIDVEIVSHALEFSGRPARLVLVRDVTKPKRMERLLREAEAKYRELVEHLPLVTYVIDEHGSTLYMSPQVETMLGYPASEWLRDPGFFVSLVHPDDRARVEAEIEHARATNDPFRSEYRLITRDGRVVWAYDETVRVESERGPLARGFLADITVRKQAETERERLLAAEQAARAELEAAQRNLAVQNERLLEAERLTHLGSWEWDVAADEITWSDELYRIWGLDPKEFGASYEAFLGTVHPDDRELVDAALRAAFETGGFEYECRIVRRDGAERFVNARGRLVLDESGARQRMIGTAQDVTERREIELERERLLAREREQNARLRELDRMKDTFVATVSHELRTPLTSITGFLHVLLEGSAGGLSNEQRRFLGIACRNADRLHRIVNDLLFITQVDAQKLNLQLEEVDLVEMARTCVKAARPAAEECGVALELSAGLVPRVPGDPGRLAQLLDNLVSNGLKFTPARGRVQVRVFSRDGHVVLEVEDGGYGIPAAEREHLFERFFRTSTASELAIQGTGLGLSIAKTIVEAHGGKITVESEEGTGSLFRVELPLERETTAVPAESGSG